MSRWSTCGTATSRRPAGPRPLSAGSCVRSVSGWRPCGCRRSGPRPRKRAPGWLAELHEQRRAFREELERRQNVRVPDEDPDYGDQGEAWPVWRGQREAILQPPKPEIRPAEAVLEKAREKQAET